MCQSLLHCTANFDTYLAEKRTSLYNYHYQLLNSGFIHVHLASLRNIGPRQAIAHAVFLLRHCLKKQHDLSVTDSRSYWSPMIPLDSAWARIIVRAKLRIFATPMLADRRTYENRNSAYLLTHAWSCENSQLSAYENPGPAE